MWCYMLHYVFIMSFNIYVNSRGTVTQHLSCMYYTCVYLCVSLLVALDCIGQVYQLDVTNQEHITTYSIDKSLEVSWNIACTCVCAGSNVYCYPQFHFCNLQCIYTCTLLCQCNMPAFQCMEVHTSMQFGWGWAYNQITIEAVSLPFIQVLIQNCTWPRSQIWSLGARLEESGLLVASFPRSTLQCMEKRGI